jgi:cytochrome d ubiquinol oxidase subunit II
MLNLIWFCLVALMLAAYVVLDGFDLGAGAIHFLVAHTPEERRRVLGAVGPVWDGNEVWLLAAGGTLYFAFPALYASSFSGFYLPLMMVLWLLILRGVSIEFRNHLDSPVWTPLFDTGFSASSALLAIFFGAALGNVIRGVPLDSNGDFFLPLWTNFLPGPVPGILDWYTILTGVLALAALAMHGALWVAYKTEGDLHARGRDLARGHPWGAVFPLLALSGLAGVRWCKDELGAFLSSCIYLTGMLTSAAFGIFPYVLPSDTATNAAGGTGLTIYNTAPAAYGLKVGLAWWIPGMALACAYFVFVYRRFAGKVH